MRNLSVQGLVNCETLSTYKYILKQVILGQNMQTDLHATRLSTLFSYF